MYMFKKYLNCYCIQATAEVIIYVTIIIFVALL